MPPLLSKCFELRSVLQFLLLLFSPLDSHLSLSRSLGVCHVMLNISKKTYVVLNISKKTWKGQELTFSSCIAILALLLSS
jgi:hypothetical protein